MKYRIIFVDDNLRMHGEEAYMDFNAYDKALSCFNSVVADLKSDTLFKEVELTLMSEDGRVLDSFKKEENIVNKEDNHEE